MLDVEIKLLDAALYQKDPNAEASADPALPQYATPGSCAFDLRCRETVTIPAHGTAKVGSGIALYSGAYFTDDDGNRINDADGKAAVAAVVIPRSGLGSRGLVLGNLVGLIDEDYQGEISMTLWNRTDNEMKVERGDRVAQLMFTLAIKPNLRLVHEFSETTERGVGGHGSTGVS